MNSLYLTPFLYSIPLVLIVVLTIGDFRHRYVDLWALVLFGVVAASLSVLEYGWRQALGNTLINIALLVYLCAGIVLWLRLRNGRWINPLRGHVGSGDLVFMLCLTPLYDLRGYLLMVLLASAAALVWWILVRWIFIRYNPVRWAMIRIGKRQVTIPLVAMLGIVAGAELIIRMIAAISI